MGIRPKCNSDSSRIIGYGGQIPVVYYGSDQLSILKFSSQWEKADLLEVPDLFDDSLDGNVVGEGIHVHAHVTDFHGELDGFPHAEFAKFLVSFGAFDNDEWIDHSAGTSVEFADGKDEPSQEFAAFFANDSKAIAALDFSAEVFFGVEFVDPVPIAMLGRLLDHTVGLCELLLCHVVNDHMTTVEQGVHHW